MNRLYYAVFYAVSAFLKKRNKVVKSHNGVKIFVHQELGKNGLITTEETKLFDVLFNSRNEGDYDNFVVFSKTEIDEMLIETKKFLDKIQTLLSDNK